ncbi:2-succinyl-5-enolpyruvyl-6-hydroxy-3-cyclohexene-1-carboxylic-acid synthase [Iamia sp. SCSIO 61187]|uniref:2-succinyl-5-enolpyruvyl-6-hydroxy-3- cyclohexene-1-carboxylic-acid synthase n=1 Tax=Iamia sp. SCSIO 61187 TaxID=2722752 RepID=UPI001C626B62|nr:2-succinyl-5-enolpyruvyl-6-hydroxy-3-cyclohexene-1-carboxylic-acid synthase [Iamia sp. SCSIO 61187]QYG93374.1 2-succinyl-5-enolpyruvyl-6-hydroxy-3-cyclohexene-1-carboxylic-acid synthase [Iamia sp. SCSIO 61187]
MDTRPQDVAATYCATLVDEWARAGVRAAVVCPGSRSTPMALALHGDERIAVHVHHDERAGAFTALGIGLATGRPAIVLTTSGTAAAEVHAAVVEAHQASVPLIVVTADRPAELADVGAPQTIAQVGLYGSAVRWADAPGVPDHAARGTWRARASRAVGEAVGGGGAGRPGPVHLDLAFREPLVGTPADLPPGRPDGAPWLVTSPVRRTADVDALAAVLRQGRRGVVVAGTEPGEPLDGPRSVGAAAPRIAAALGWPLLLDARVRGRIDRGGSPEAVVVGTADALLREPDVAATLRPDVVVHLGAPVASRVVNEWVTGADAVEVRVGAHGWIDPAHRTALHVPTSAAALVDALDARDVTLAPDTEPGWTDRWRAAEGAAQDELDGGLVGETLTEPGTARTVLAALHDGEALVVSSSMPVRDLEWYGRPRGGVAVHANRGANGIDGVVSTAVGVALATGAPTACLIGDVALLHDSTALIGVAGRGITLTIVVVDNDGGGIFSFLPQASDPGGAPFEDLFGTPHGVDLRVLAAAHSLMTIEPATAAEVGPAVRASLEAGGVRLVRVGTDRTANVDVHRRLHAAVADAVRPLVAPPRS